MNQNDYLRMVSPYNYNTLTKTQSNTSYSQNKKELAKSEMMEWFTSHPSYFQMKYKKDGLIYDVVLEDKKSLNSVTSWRSLYSFKQMALGDYFTIVDNNEIFKDVIWITTKKDPYNGVYFRYDVRECNKILKYYNKSGKLIEKPCIYESKNPYNEGEKTYPQIILGANQRALILPNDEDTKILRRGFDFMFDDLAYKITSYDTETEPELLYLICTEFQRGSQDETDLSNQNKHVYTINIQESNLSVKVHDTKQLNIIILEDNKNPVIRDVIYESSDKNIATVSNTGLVTCVGVGNCTITAKLKDNDMVKDTCDVKVDSIVVDNITYDFDVNSQTNIIYFSRSKDYSFYEFNNGIQLLYDKFTFGLNYLGKDSRIATLEKINGNSCRVTANKKERISGVVRLEVYDSSNNNVLVGSKDITIKFG